MSDNTKAHIRDIMALSKADFAAGKPATTSLCGLSDPDMNKLEFAYPDAIFHKELPNYCERCRNIWKDEYESTGEKKFYNKVRKMIADQSNLSRLQRRR